MSVSGAGSFVVRLVEIGRADPVIERGVEDRGAPAPTEDHDGEYNGLQTE
jgi:hypothetical protein